MITSNMGSSVPPKPKPLGKQKPRPSQERKKPSAMRSNASANASQSKSDKGSKISTSQQSKRSSASNKTKSTNITKKNEISPRNRTEMTSFSSNKAKIPNTNIRQDGTSSQLRKERKQQRRQSGKMIAENPQFGNNHKNYNEIIDKIYDESNSNNNNNNDNCKLKLPTTRMAPISNDFVMQGYSHPATPRQKTMPKVVIALGALMMVVGIVVGLFHEQLAVMVDDIKDSVNVALVPGIVNLSFKNEGGVSNDVQIAFKEAANFWNTVIIDDLDDNIKLFEGKDEVVNTCKDGDLPLENDGSITVNGLEVFVKIQAIDGPGKILGQAAPCVFQILPDTKNKYRVRGGVMTFDEVDLDELAKKNSLSRVIIHEMAHVLGIGTLWRVDGTVVAPFIEDVGFIYTGKDGLEGYNDLDGQLDSPPVEQDFGFGTAGGHWDEDTFGNELMTGFINDNKDNPLSIMSIKALKDLGYTVRESEAEIYTIPSASRGNSNGDDEKFRIDLRNDVVFDGDALSKLFEEAAERLRGFQ